MTDDTTTRDGLKVEEVEEDIPLDDLEGGDAELNSTMESAGGNDSSAADVPSEPPTIPGAPPTIPDSTALDATEPEATADSATADRPSVELELSDDDIVAAAAPPRPPPSRKPPPKPPSTAPAAIVDNGQPVAGGGTQPILSQPEPEVGEGTPSKQPPVTPSTPPRPASKPPLSALPTSSIPPARVPSLGAPIPPPPPAPMSNRPLSRPPGPVSNAASRPPSQAPPAPSANTPSRPASAMPEDDHGADNYEAPSPKPPSLADLSPDSTPSPPLAAVAVTEEEEEAFDAAKTAKFERRPEEPSIPDDDEAPPDIPSLAAAAGPDDSGSHKSPKPRRSRKGKRSTVKIPDDSVPATPTPPAVADGQAKAEAELSEEDSEPSYPVDEPAEDILDPATPLPEPVAAPDSGEELDPDDLEEDDADGTRKSAPGIFTDEATIGVLRPIQIVSDLPAMPPAEDLEELEPESIPDGPPLPPPKHPEGGELSNDATASARRPPPPPRHADLPLDALDEIEEVEPDRMSMPMGELDATPRPPPPPHRDPHPIGVADETGQQQAISVADLAPAPPSQSTLAEMEADAALAEARAKEAEARAVEAEAKARAAAANAEAAARKSKAGKKRPWWIEMFEDDLIRTLDNPKKRDVEKESTFIEKSLRLDKGSRILDLGCGTGVHAVELSLRGYQVVGVDLSTTMLELAKKYNDRRGASVSFIQGDMRQLNLEGVFDGIYCWSSTFGFFDEQHNGQVLERVARALRQGGMFALDACNRDFIAARSPAMAWFEKPGCVCMDEMRFDFYSSRMVTKRMVLFDTGRSREVEMSIRLYTLHELGRMLHKVGFKVLEVSGHRAHRGAYFGHESPRIIITSERRGEEDSRERSS